MDKEKDKQKVIDFYDNYAQNWDERFKRNKSTKHFLEKRVKIIEDLANFHGQERVLEIGCGTAFHLISLADSFKSGTGTDASPRMIALAKEKAQKMNKNNLNFILDDSEKLSQFPNDTFDVVFFEGLLEHLMNPLDCFKNSWRVLNKGGRFIGITPNKFSPWYNVIGPILRGRMKHLVTDKYYSARKIALLLEQTNFCEKTFTYWGFIPAGDFPDFLFNFLSKIEPLLEKSPLKYFAGGIAFMGIKK